MSQTVNQIAESHRRATQRPEIARKGNQIALALTDGRTVGYRCNSTAVARRVVDLFPRLPGMEVVDPIETLKFAVAVAESDMFRTVHPRIEAAALDLYSKLNVGNSPLARLKAALDITEAGEAHAARRHGRVLA